MKALKYIVLIIFVISASCKEEKPKTTTTKKELSSNIQHYYCADKCENSGGDVAGNCPVCKKPYTHNVAFHDKDLLKNGPLNVPQTNQNQTQPDNTSKSPAQNAYGDFHYICNNGCIGGSGSASKCNTCGETLAHNTLYHK